MSKKNEAQEKYDQLVTKVQKQHEADLKQLKEEVVKELKEHIDEVLRSKV